MPILGMAGSSVMLLSMKDALKVAIDLGFKAFELSGEFPQCYCDDISGEQRDEARSLADSSGIAMALHAPFTSLNIAALNPGIRAESIRQTLAAIDLCADLGGKRVVVHSGKYILSDNFRKRSPEAFDIQWKYNVESLKLAAERAEKRGVFLCLENIGFEENYIDKCVDDLLRIREEAGSGALAFCLDIGHARLNKELTQAITKIGPFTRHIHFTDNFGERDDHIIIGTGNFDYSPHMDFFRNFKDIITLEVINIGKNPEPAGKSLEYAKKLFGLK